MVVDAQVETDLYELGPDGVALTDLSQSTMMSLRLELDTSFGGSVEFVIYNPQMLASIPVVENSYPYSLVGDSNITGHFDYRGWRATVGQHTVYIRIFTGKDLSGDELCSRDVTFDVIPHRDGLAQTTVYSSQHRGGCTAPESHIDGLAECSAAGALLGLTEQAAQTNPQLQHSRPYGCTWDEGRAPDGSRGGHLRWNTLGRLNMDDVKRQSICKIVTAASISPTPSPTPVPTTINTACDPESWDAVKNGEICTDLSSCSALIDFENIASANCGDFCASHGLRCDDADDDTRNRCQVLGRTSDRYTCDTPIVRSTGWDAICYCSDPPLHNNIDGGKDSATSSSITAEQGPIVTIAALAIAAVAIVGAVTWKVVRSQRLSDTLDNFVWDSDAYNSPSSQPAGCEAFRGTSPGPPLHETLAFEPEDTRWSAASSLTDISDGVASDPHYEFDFDFDVKFSSDLGLQRCQSSNSEIQTSKV